MKKIVFIVLLMCFGGCKTIKTVPLENRVTIKERLVPVAVPSDSATISLVFSLIPETKQLILSGYSEQKTSAVETAIKQDSNSVIIRFKTIRDSIFVPVRDTLVKRDIPVVVEVEKKKAATPWIIASIAAGVVALLLLIIIILRK